MLDVLVYTCTCIHYAYVYIMRIWYVRGLRARACTKPQCACANRLRWRSLRLASINFMGVSVIERQFCIEKSHWECQFCPLSGIEKRPFLGGWFCTKAVSVPQTLSAVGRLSSFRRVRYGRFDCILSLGKHSSTSCRRGTHIRAVYMYMYVQSQLNSPTTH